MSDSDEPISMSLKKEDSGSDSEDVPLSIRAKAEDSDSSDAPITVKKKKAAPKKKVTKKKTPAKKKTTAKKGSAKKESKVKKGTTVKKEQPKFEKIGQRRPTPEDLDVLRMFYESLYKERPESPLAEKWMMIHGLLGDKEAIAANKKYGRFAGKTEKSSTKKNPASKRKTPSKASKKKITRQKI